MRTFALADCGNVTVRTSIVLSILLILLIVAVAVGAISFRRKALRSRAEIALIKKFYRMVDLWASTGMQFKVKAVVGLYQCIAAVPSVFGVTTPVGVQSYTRWMTLLELPAELQKLIVQPACLGSYRRHASVTFPSLILRVLEHIYVNM